MFAWALQICLLRPPSRKKTVIVALKVIKFIEMYCQNF